MAEVQKTTLSGELSQRFIEFVVMHAQNAALFLGQIPNPKTGQGEVNLDLARMFIDQLAMIQEKTRGNLTNEEAKVLSNALSNLQTWKLRGNSPKALRKTRRRKPRHHQNRRRNHPQPSPNHQLPLAPPSPRQNPGRNSPKATGHSSLFAFRPSRSRSCGRGTSQLRLGHTSLTSVIHHLE